jgi:hypothetical protein
MSKIRIIAAVVILPLLISLIAEGATGQSKKKRRGHVKKVETVTIGTWGGRHVGMQVTGDGAQLDFDCAHATITQPLKLNSDGSFDAQGLYVKEHGGPVRSDEDQSGQPAHFKGKLTGQTMTLTITLEGTAEAIGPFTLEHGKYARIFKCM